MKPVLYEGATETVWYLPSPSPHGQEPNDETITEFKWHREDGPAYMSDKYTEYWINDKPHRYDGPAIVWLKSPEVKGQKTWYIHGVVVDENEYISWLEESGMDINNLSDNDKVLIDLRWRHD